METVGVAPVPDAQRHMTPWKMFIVWAMASASATTPLIASLLYSFGLRNMILAIVIAWLIGLIPAGLFSEMGRQVPLTALIVARHTYGLAGSFLLSILFTLVNAGWFGLNTAIGAQILNALAPVSSTFWMWVVGGVQVVLVLFGMKWLEYFYRYTSALFVVCYGALAVYLFTHYSLTAPQPHGTLHWGLALTTILSFSILAWTYKTSTVSRFAEPAGRTHGPKNAAYFLAPSVGIMLAVLLMGVVGIYSMEGIKSWNVALLGPHIPVWGFLAAIGVALAIVHTNAMNLYPSTVDLLVALNTFRKPHRWEQPIATVVLGVLATLLAVGGILDHVQNFLASIGDVVFPFTFVMLADWLVIQRRATPADAFFEQPRGFLGWVSLPGAVAFCVGVVISAWGDRVLPAVFYNDLPLPVVGSLIAAAIYLALALPLRHRLAEEYRRPAGKAA
jgi:purine-cytosine permease-like protein